MRTRPTAWLLGAALVLAACGAGGSEQPGAADRSTAPGAASASPSPSPSRAPTSGPPDAGSPASPAASGPPHESLAFEAPLLDGGTFDGAVSGDVVLWFWAPW